MAQTNLNDDSDVSGFDAGVDSITIVNYIEGVPGGRSLDVTGFTPKVIMAGHVVIKENTTGNHKPMPVNAAGNAYDTLPANHSYAGVVVSSVMTNKAMVGIMVRGSVNESVSPYPLTTAIKQALPLIRFVKD